MPSGDIHNYGQCWCGLDHSQSIWQDGYDAGYLAGAAFDPVIATPPDALCPWDCARCTEYERGPVNQPAPTPPDAPRCDFDCDACRATGDEVDDGWQERGEDAREGEA